MKSACKDSDFYFFKAKNRELFFTFLHFRGHKDRSRSERNSWNDGNKSMADAAQRTGQRGQTCTKNIIDILRLTLSCTFSTTWKSCFQGRKTRFGMLFSAFRGVILSVLEGKIVKVRLQNSQSESARLTLWQRKIDYIGGVLHRFWQAKDMTENQKITYSVVYQQHTQ